MNGKQLKNSILQWAIQGKLVPQDPNDEPASVLLERIRQEKARLVKEGKIKKDKNESIIYRGDDNSHYEKFADGEVRCMDSELPFELPKGWEWVRLKNVVFNHGQKIPDKRFSYIDIDSIDNKRQRLNEKENIIEAKDAPSRARKIVEENDIIYSTVRPYLHNLAIIDKEFSEEPIASTGFAVFSCFKGLFNKFLFFYLLSPDFDNYANDGDNSKGVAYPAINDDRLYKALIPIPPFAEQHRIVTKLEELVPFIEKYNTAQNHLDTLNDELNGLLKKSILQEAIQGWPTLPILKEECLRKTEEPATKLLEFIRDEKNKLVKAGKLKAKDIVDSVIFKGDDNKYYQLINGSSVEITSDFEFPDSWEVVRLFDICRLTDGERKQGRYVCLDAKYLRGKSSGNFLGKGKFVTAGDNIILVDGENSGEVFTVPCDGYMGSTFKQLWVSNEMHLPYVLYFIQFYKDRLHNSKKGAAIPHLNKEVFYNLLIGIPPIKEQTLISSKIAETNGYLQIAK